MVRGRDAQTRSLGRGGHTAARRRLWLVYFVLLVLVDFVDLVDLVVVAALAGAAALPAAAVVLAADSIFDLLNAK